MFYNSIWLFGGMVEKATTTVPLAGGVGGGCEWKPPEQGKTSIPGTKNEKEPNAFGYRSQKTLPGG